MKPIFVRVLFGLLIIAGLSLATPAALADTTHLLINEIQTASAASVNEEFIELYNPTLSDVSLNGWSIVRYSSSGSKNPLLTSFPAGTTMPAHSYLLVGAAAEYYSGYADVRYPKSYSIADNNAIELLDASAARVDLLGFGSSPKNESASAPNPPKGSSIGRSNSVDTDNNQSDFALMSSSAKSENFVAAPEASETTTAVDTSDYRLTINELLPNPSGSDNDGEFIELKNLDSVSRDLSGFKLRDMYLKSRSSFYILPAGTTIPADGFLVLPYSQTKITLNNTGDELELLTPDGNLLASTPNYNQAIEGQSYSLIDGSYIWITPSSGTINPVPAIAEESESSTDAGSARIIISELLPDPVGNDTAGEFIELTNLDPVSHNLGGYKLRDKYLKDRDAYYIFPEDLIISAHGFLALSYADTKITLNNSGDSLELLTPDDKVLSLVAYETAVEGLSLIFDGSSYVWTSKVTVGQGNELIPSLIAAKPTKDTKAKTKKTSTAKAKLKNPLKTKVELPEAEQSDQKNVTLPKANQIAGWSFILMAGVVAVGSRYAQRLSALASGGKQLASQIATSFRAFIGK